MNPGPGFDSRSEGFENQIRPIQKTGLGGNHNPRSPFSGRGKVASFPFVEEKLIAPLIAIPNVDKGKYIEDKRRAKS